MEKSTIELHSPIKMVIFLLIKHVSNESNSEITGVAPTENSSPENTYEHEVPCINSPENITETNTTN